MLQRVMAVVWPAFLCAGVLEMLVFALVDPQDLHWHGQAIALTRQGIYTLSFFLFWLIAAASSGMTQLLLKPAGEVNRVE